MKAKATAPGSPKATHYNVGGDVIVESLQDTEETNNQGFGVSVSFTGGANSLSVNQGHTDRSEVTEQSGIYSSGGVSGRIGGNVVLNGGVMINDGGPNTVELGGSVITTDLSNRARIESQGLSIGLGGGIPSLAPPTRTDNATDSTTYAVLDGITFTDADGSTGDTRHIRNDIEGANIVLADPNEQDHNALAIFATTLVATTAQEYMANAIGDAYANGTFNSATHKLAHAVSGCVTGALLNDDCGGGAAGAVVGEVAAELYANSHREEALANGVSEQAFDEQVRQIASLATSVTVGVTGHDATVASITSQIAVDNNYLNHTQQRLYATSLNAAWEDCGGDITCFDAKKAALDGEYQGISDQMNDALRVAQSACVEQGNCAQVAQLLKEASSQYSANSRYQVAPEIIAKNPHLTLTHLGINDIDPAEEWAQDQASNQRKVDALLGRQLDQEITGSIGFTYNQRGEVITHGASFSADIDTTDGYVDKAKVLVDFLPVVGTVAGFASASSELAYAIEVLGLLPGGKLLAKAIALKKKLANAENLSDAELAALTREVNEDLASLKDEAAGQGNLGVPNRGQQTGAGGYIDPADLEYDNIRTSITDVDTIAANTGLKPQNIQKIKDHLFIDDHILDRYVNYGVPAETKRFDSDIKIAEAWKRLETGNHTIQDIQLLKHETAERWIEKKRGAGYTESHDRATERYPAPDWWSE